MRVRPVLIALAILAGPLGASAEQERAGERVSVSQPSADMTFAAGGEVDITAQVSDDIFAMGGRIRVDQASADHLFVAGGEIEIASGQVRDIVGGGGDVRLARGAVADDVVLVGGALRLGPEASVGGSAMMAGRQLRIEAPIGAALTAAGGRIELNSAVGGAARLYGGRVVVGPNARIAGDLTVSGEQIDISPQAVITGRTIREERPEVGEARHAAAAAFGVIAGFIFLGSFLLHGIIAAGLPALMRGASDRISGRLWMTLGTGALIILVGPVLLGVLAATLIGAPLALALLLAFVALWAPSFTAIAYWIGQFARSRLARKSAENEPGAWARFWWTLLGAILMGVAFLIPLLGALAWLFALLAGTGAVIAQTAHQLRNVAPAGA